MCFLITAVVEFLVVVQTGAIDLPVGKGVWDRSCLIADTNTWTLTLTHTAMAWCRHLNKLQPNLCERSFSIIHPEVIEITACDTQIYRKRANLEQGAQSVRAVALSLIFLINKSHYTLMLPPLFVSVSLDVSTKSQRVAPQARRRYLVIHIEIYGLKWGEGRQADSLSAYQYPPLLSTPYHAANLLATQCSFWCITSLAC